MLFSKKSDDKVEEDVNNEQKPPIADAPLNQIVTDPSKWNNIIRLRCEKCGFLYEGVEMITKCPRCGAGKEFLREVD